MSRIASSCTFQLRIVHAPGLVARAAFEELSGRTKLPMCSTRFTGIPR